VGFFDKVKNFFKSKKEPEYLSIHSIGSAVECSIELGEPEELCYRSAIPDAFEDDVERSV